MITNRVLILEQSPKRKDDLAVILSFLGEDVEFFNFNAKLSDLDLKKQQYKAIILGEPYNLNKIITQKFKDYLYYIKDLKCSNLILLLEYADSNNLPVVIRKLITTTLTWPSLYYDLVLALNYQQKKVQSLITIEDKEDSVSYIGMHPDIIKVKQLVTQVAVTNASVLICGESGTGKEIIAKNIHVLSNRKGSFVAINCAAIPAELLESELFGHEKGSFTGAIASRMGKFEQAEQGTLFLDEIGDMPINMQVKLLRVLQNNQFERVGGNKVISTNIRIIAATNNKLEDKIRDNKFREDLFYRLNVFPIFLPPLRERLSDIPLLIRSYLRDKGSEPILHILPKALEALINYSWPGNVRELYNLLEQLLILYPNGKIDLEELPGKFSRSNNKYSHSYCLTNKVKEIEKEFIKKALFYFRGNLQKAALYLQIDHKILLKKIKEYGFLDEVKDSLLINFNEN